MGILILINIFRFFTARLGPNKYVEDNLEFIVYEVDLSIFDRVKKKNRPLAKRLETIFASSLAEKKEITFEWHVVKLEMMQPASMSVMINLSSKYHP